MNFYSFDYRLVLDEDPSYERFVDKEVIEHGPESRQHDTNEEVIYNQRSKDDTETESDIIDFVHDGSADTINTRDIRPDFGGDADEESFTETIVNLKDKYENPQNPDFNPSILALPPPNRFLLPGSRAWQNEDTVYEFARGSRRSELKFISPMVTYRFSRSENKIRIAKASYWFDRKRNVTSEMRKHFYMLVYNTETKQLYRLRNKKVGSRFQKKLENIFNILPHAYSHISYTPNRIQNKFINAITEAAVKDVPGLIMLDINEAGPSTVRRPRIEGGTRKVIGIPDFITSKINKKEAETLNFMGTILQHKVGQPMPWLNLVLLQNMCDIMSNTDYYKRIFSGGRILKSYTEDIQKVRKKTVFKLVPNLRKSNHMKTAVKTLLGDYHHNFFLRLFNTIRLESFLPSWISCEHHNLIRKNIRHWLAQSISNNSDIPLLRDVMKVISFVLEYLMRYGDDQTISEQESAVIDSYIKICQRLITTFKSHDPADLNKSKFLAWHTWQDLFDMANQLGIRIRPNRFESVGEIREFHDRLALIIRRDKRILLEYEDVIFDKFVSPDREYDGFKFVQLRTAEELRHEGTVMHHCVASYASRCAQGGSIIFSMRKDDKSYVTIELSPTTYKVVQQYTLHDIIITSQTVLDLIEKWRMDCLELHKNEKETYYEKYAKKEKIDKLKAKIDNLKTLSTEGVVEDGKHLLSQIRKYENELEDTIVESNLQQAMHVAEA